VATDTCRRCLGRWPTPWGWSASPEALHPNASAVTPHSSAAGIIVGAHLVRPMAGWACPEGLAGPGGNAAGPLPVLLHRSGSSPARVDGLAFHAQPSMPARQRGLAAAKIPLRCRSTAVAGACGVGRGRMLATGWVGRRAAGIDGGQPFACGAHHPVSPSTAPKSDCSVPADRPPASVATSRRGQVTGP
jgi:hypothetical protein